jgi:hypothetical protein
MEARLRALTQTDVDAAFAQAERNGSALLAFTDHDFRDMAPEIDKVRGFIVSASARRPEVRFAYSDALTAARSHLGCPAAASLGLQARIVSQGADSRLLEVSAGAPLFGPQPFLAIKDKKGNYYCDNFDFTLDPRVWRYTLDWQTFRLEDLAAIGVAGVGAAGEVEILLIDPATGTMNRTLLN